MLEKKNIELVEERRDGDEYQNYSPNGQLNEKIVVVNDSILWEQIKTAKTVLGSNPETVEFWLKKVIEDYDKPLLEWKDWYEQYYRQLKAVGRSPLEILNEFIADSNR